MVYLEHTKHPNLDMDRVTLKDANCKLADLGDFNGTHLWFEVPLDGCMTNHTTADDTITYANSIIAETRASQGSFLISREFQAEFPFKCTYPRSAILSVASFSPREKVIYTRTGKKRSLGPILNSLWDPPAWNHGSCIHYLGLDICFEECNCRDFLQAHFLLLEVSIPSIPSPTEELKRP